MKLLFTVFAFAMATVCLAQKDPKEFHLDKEFKISVNGTFQLKASDAKVTITGSSRETAHIKIDRVVTAKGWIFGKEAFDVDIREEAGNLIMNEKPHSIGGIVGYYSEKYTITIELPRGVSIQVRGADGNFKVNTMDGAVSFDLDDADVDLTDCGGGNFYFNLDDGHVRMNQGKGKLQIKGDDADVDIVNGAFTSVRASTDDGNLSIETSLADGGEYDINAEDGMVTLAITSGGGKIYVHHDDGRVSADSKFVLTNDSDEHKQYNLATGSANVDIRTDDARVKLISR